MYASVLMIALRWYRNCKNPMVKDELLSTVIMLLMVGKSAEDEQVVMALIKEKIKNKNELLYYDKNKLKYKVLLILPLS